MSELLKKYESLDQSKLNEGTIKILNRVKTITADFTADDAKNNKIAEDVLNEVMKKNPNAVKIVKRTPKAKTAPKKTHKATHTTKGTHTTSSTAKTSNNIMSVTKEIQKAGESWKDAMERAKAVIKERKEKVVQKQKTELEKLYNLVKTKKELQGFANSDIRRDSVREAKVRGARFVTKEGNTSNKYGTFPNKLGRKYWETRDRHADRLAPNYPKDMPLLASGGGVDEIENIDLGNNFEIKLEKLFYESGDFTYGTSLYYKNKLFKFFTVIPNATKKEAIENVYKYLKTLSVSQEVNETKQYVGNKIEPLYTIFYNDRGGEHLRKANFKKEIEQFITDVNAINSKKFADGGYTQGYDDREDERLAMKYGKIANKDLDSTHSRRDDARFEERGKMANGGTMWTKEKVENEITHYKNLLRNIDKYPNYNKKNVEKIISEYEEKLAKNEFADGGAIDGGMNNLTIQNVSFAKGGSVKKVPAYAKKRLEELREEIRAERISYGELAELQSLAQYIEPNDVELLEPAGVPEFEEDDDNYAKGGKLTKSEVMRNMYKPSGDYFFEQKGNDLIVHLTSRDAGNSITNLMDKYDVKDNGRGYHGSSYILSRKNKLANGGSLPFMTDPNFGNFQNTGAFAHGGSVKKVPAYVKKRLEELRKEIRAERISYEELAELQSLAQYIDPNDVELLEPAGVPEFEEEEEEEFIDFSQYDTIAYNLTEEDAVKLADEQSEKNPNSQIVLAFTGNGFNVYVKKSSFANGGELKDFEQTVKDALKVNNKWHFISQNVDGKFVQLKMYVGTKEVDVQIFKIDGVYASMPKNYAGKRETLKMIMNNFNANYELGGAFMTTDLAGHSGGGTGGLNANMPLSGVSGTYYTGLVGETGAMSSGELFMDGGAMAQNQQVINDASQSYVNYYLGEGASQGIYKDGGAIVNQYEGRTPEDVWNNWDLSQKLHFLSDHTEEVYGKASVKGETNNEINEFFGKLIYEKYDDLPLNTKVALVMHTTRGQYAKGGSLGKALYVAWSGYFDYNKYDEEKIMSALKSIGAKNIRLEKQYDNYNHPEVVVFNGNKRQAEDALNEAFGIDYGILIWEKDWRAKKMADGGFTPDVSDGTQFMSGVYANGGSVGDVSGNYYSTTDFVSQNNLMDLAKSTFGQDWESGGDYDYDTEEIKMLVKKLGGGYKIVYVDSEEREKFENAKSKYLPLLKNKSNDGDIFVIPNKKKADGGFTTDVSDGTQFMSGVYANGGGIRSKEELKKIFSEKEAIVKNLTPKQIAEMWNKNSYGVKQGISKPITIEEAKKPSMKIYLENLLIENELTEEEQAKYFANGGFTPDVSDGTQFMSGVYANGGAINGSLNKKILNLAEKKGFTIEKAGKDLYNKSMTQALVESLTDANYHDEAKEVVVKAEGKTKWSDELYESEYFNPTLPIITDFAREVARECKWDGDDILNAYYFITKMQGSKVGGMIDDLFFNKNPRTKVLIGNSKKPSKYIDNADINFVVLKIKGKTVTISGRDVLNGANLLEDGGDLTKIAFYVPKRDVVEVILKNGETIKPVNGYWVKKGYEPITRSSTPKTPAKGKVTSPNYPNVNFNHKVVINGKTINLALAKSYVTGLNGSRQYDFIDVDGNPKTGYGFSVKEALKQVEDFGNNPMYYSQTTNTPAKIDENKAHFQADALGNVFVDSNFINQSKGNLPNSELKHYGFGEFYLETPDGNIEFIRTDEEKEGFVGRTHKMKGSDELVLKLVNAMKEKGKFESTQTFKKGGRVSVNYSGRKSKENWGKNDLYEMYDNSIDLDADLADYFKDYEKDFGKEEADREKKELMETLKLGKTNFNDGASLTFANGGGFANDPFYKAFMEKRDKLYAQLKSRVVRAVGIDEAMEFFDYEYSSIAPYKFIERAVQSNLIALDEINKELVDSAMEEAREIDNDEDLEEIGSSDFTYYLQHVLDGAGFKVGFVNDRLQRLNEDGSVKEIENNFADGGFMNDVYAKGGELKGKFLAEIKVPYNYESVVKDEFEFTEFLSKTLTKKWFGNGVWGVKMVKPLFERDYSKRIVVEIEIPVGVTQGGGLDKFDVGEFISKTLTKKWFGNGIWGVDIVRGYADGGFMNDVYAKGGGVKGDRYDGKTEKIVEELKKLKGGLDNKAPYVYQRDGFIYVSAEEGDNYADYDNYLYIDEKLEEFADKYDTYWEWENAGAIVLFPLSDKDEYADGGMFDDNDGFMKADNNNNYRYPEMEVYVETLDEPIDLTNNVSSKTNEVVIIPLDEKIDLNNDNRVRARMGFEPKNRTPEKMMMVNQRMVIKDLPTPMSNTHKND
jgi:hypothetical protein